MKKVWRRWLAFALSLVIAFGTLQLQPNSAQAAPGPDVRADGYQSVIPTPQGNAVINPHYDRSWDEYVVVSDNGLVHPGVLHSRADLNLMRDMVWLGQEPWASGFEKLRTSPESAKVIAVYGKGGSQRDFAYETVSDSSGDKQLRQDATTAYQQALMWYITGDDAYRNNAISVLDAWADGLNNFFGTTEPANWDDVALIWGASSVLSSGVAGQKMAAAAEILLYTPSSGWCRDAEGNIDYAAKAKYDRFFRLIWQESNKWYGYFNQAAVGNKGYMSIAIFLDDINGYNEAVERFAVNKKAINETGNSTNFSVASLILDHGQIVEMGRDQPHSADDVGALAGAARTIYVQGTQLDPVTGEPVSSGGVNPYEFQNRKLLNMISYYATYNLGFDVEYRPNVNGMGHPMEWSTISTAGRGAYAEMVSIYNYYKYIAGYEGPEFHALYRHPELMIQSNYPEGQSIDRPGFGQLLFTPANAALEETPKGPPQPLADTGSQYGLYDRRPIIPFDSNNSVYFKNGYVSPGIASYLDEDGKIQFKAEGTMNGNWIGYEGFHFGDKPADTIAFTYSLNAGSGSTVSVYITEPDVELTDANMASTVPDATFHMPNTGWWTNVNTHVQKLEGLGAKAIGVKNLYFKFSGSNNVYNFAAEPFWFQFSGTFARTDNRAVDAPIRSSEAYAEDAAGETVILSDGGYIGYPNANFDRGTRQLQLRHTGTGSGVLELRLGAPDGELIKSYPIADTAGAMVTSSFDHTDAERVYGLNGGLNDLYLTYKGAGAIGIDSFRYSDPIVAPQADPTLNKGSGYQYDNGLAAKSGDSAILQGDGSAVVFRNANMGFRNGERGFMAIRVKSDESMTIKAIDLLNGNAATNTVATFRVPDTEGEFVTLAYDLALSGHQNREGTIFLRLETSGGSSQGSAEVQYFTFNNDEIQFQDGIAGVAIASSNANPAIATAGDTITLAIAATEPIQDVKVYFGTTLMPVTIVDFTTFEVKQTLGENYFPGKINFRVDYNINGNYGRSVGASTDGSEVTVVDEPGLINEIFKTATLIDSTPGRAIDATRVQTNSLFDRTTGTISDFRTSNGGTGAWIAFDFGLSKKVLLDKVKLLARSDQTARANGIVIQGRNHWDQESWTTITNAAANNANWQTLNALPNTTPYRYLRVYNAGAWFGNMDELKFYGSVMDIGEPIALTDVTLQSDNPEDDGYARDGHRVTLSFVAAEPIAGVDVRVGGASVPAASHDDMHWNATFAVTAAHQKGNIGFVITYDDAPAVTSTTDGSSVAIIDTLEAAIAGAESLQAQPYTKLSFRQFRQELAEVRDIMNEASYSETALVLRLDAAKAALQGIAAMQEKLSITQAMVAASTAAWGGGADAAQNGWRAFDGNLTNTVDTTANPSWVGVDLGEGNGQIVGTFRFHPRSTHIDRVNGASLQGSNDGETWTTLHTISGINSAGWHSAAIQAPDVYRYYRYYAPAGNANISEIELIKPVLDRSLLDYYVAQAAVINPQLYTTDSAAVLALALGQAEELLASGGYSQAQIDEAADTLEAALAGLVATTPPHSPTAWITAQAEAFHGEEVEWTIGIEGDVSFSILDVTLQYDASSIRFATVEENGHDFLAEGAIVPLQDHLQVLGGAVSGTTGEARILLSGTSDVLGSSGPLFKLIGSVREDAEIGETSIALSDFEIILGDNMATVDTSSAIAPLLIKAVSELPDKSALQALVNSAIALAGSAQPGGAPGQYPAGAIAGFNAAIEEAEGVLRDAAATAENIADAASVLEAAIETFRQSVNPHIPVDPADKSALTARIAEAEALLSRTQAGAKIGQYSSSVRGELQLALDAGKALHANAGASQNAVDAAAAGLADWMEQYRSSFVTLVPGQRKISIRDLSIVASYLGTDKDDERWSDIEAGDVLGSQQIDIRTLAAIARMILEDWLDE